MRLPTASWRIVKPCGGAWSTISIPERKIELCFNGLDPRVFHPRPHPAARARRRHGSSIGAVSFAGQKGFLPAGRFRRSVRATRPGNVQFARGGRRPHRPALAAQAAALGLGDSCILSPPRTTWFVAACHRHLCAALRLRGAVQFAHGSHGVRLRGRRLPCGRQPRADPRRGNRPAIRGSRTPVTSRTSAYAASTTPDSGGSWPSEAPAASPPSSRWPPPSARCRRCTRLSKAGRAEESFPFPSPRPDVVSMLLTCPHADLVQLGNPPCAQTCCPGAVAAESGPGARGSPRDADQFRRTHGFGRESAPSRSACRCGSSTSKSTACPTPCSTRRWTR